MIPEGSPEQVRVATVVATGLWDIYRCERARICIHGCHWRPAAHGPWWVSMRDRVGGIVLPLLAPGEGAVLKDSTSSQACGWTTNIQQARCKGLMMQIVTTWQIVILRSVEAGD